MSQRIKMRVRKNGAAKGLKVRKVSTPAKKIRVKKK